MVMLFKVLMQHGCSIHANCECRVSPVGTLENDTKPEEVSFFHELLNFCCGPSTLSRGGTQR